MKFLHTDVISTVHRDSTGYTKILAQECQRAALAQGALAAAVSSLPLEAVLELGALDGVLPGGEVRRRFARPTQGEGDEARDRHNFFKKIN
jgi:hypothetical protein